MREGVAGVDPLEDGRSEVFPQAFQVGGEKGLGGDVRDFGLQDGETGLRGDAPVTQGGEAIGHVEVGPENRIDAVFVCALFDD